MKKFYSLIAVAALASVSFGQGSETFEAQTALTATYADGSFSGETAGVTVNYVHARNQDTYGIVGKGLLLRRADEPSSVEFVIPNGVGEFTFSYRKAYTSAAPRTLALFVDGVQVDEPRIPTFGTTAGADATVNTTTAVINKTGEVRIKISYLTGSPAGNQQLTVDNINWTAPSTLGTIDYTEASKAVANTLWTNTASFNVKDQANVEVYNINGQLVKSFQVKGTQTVNVSDLVKGVYVVKTTSNGKTSTQKVVKK
jgi:hypothetical protein